MFQTGTDRSWEFSKSADVIMESRVGGKIGLMQDGSGAFGGPVALRKSTSGGYDYVQIGLGAMFTRPKHTDLDIPKECAEYGNDACQFQLQTKMDNR